MQNKEKNGSKAALIIMALVLLLGIGSVGCGKTPAVDDVAEALPGAGNIEAWSGDGEMLPEEILSLEPYAEEISEGHTMRVDSYDESGNVIGYDITEYDAESRIVYSEQFDLNDRSLNRWEYSYSEDGREETVARYEEDVFAEKMVHSYDETGKHLEMRVYDATDALRYISYFDADGGVGMMAFYSGDAGAEWKSSDLYLDETGAAVLEISYNPDGSVFEKTGHVYDEAGNEIQFTREDSEGNLLNDNRTVFEEDGRKRRDYYDENGALVYYYLEELDENGNVVREEKYSAKDELEEYSISEYDGNGNLVRETYHRADGTVREYHLFFYSENGQRERSETYEEGIGLVSYSTYVTYTDSIVVYTYDPATETVTNVMRLDSEGRLME